MTTRQTESRARPPFWRDVRVLRVVGQIVAVVLVFLLFRWLFGNLLDNSRRVGLSLDFGFLGRPTQFQIPYHSDFDPRSPVWQMVLVGVKNTLLASVFGIALAGVLGLVIGISRLSQNWLTSRIASAYVEFFRNIPPLVVIVFFAFAVFLFGPLPNLRESIEVGLPGSSQNLFTFSNEEFGVPSLAGSGEVQLFGVIAAAALIVAAVVWRWRTKINEDTGAPHHRVLWSLGILVTILAVAYFALGEPVRITWPTLSENRRRIVDGFSMNAGFMSVAGALGLYTASHVAEIVRGSILAVSRGQTEAANALALNGFQRYRFVILPQALRVALPPLINQALNLVKNTSLAAAVGYSEITNLTQASIGNGRPAVPSIVILMAVYLSFSLIISLILNVVNRRMQLVSR
ncbi:MAG TPA: ABC transporter permease subunit [Acidimicrobiia bacterium]|nr:ABC transporter permease subunit [Acidimicrobiia bacterium]